MAKYVDICVIPVPKKNMKKYKDMSARLAKVWMKCGAIEYIDSIADDVPMGEKTSFPRSVKRKPSETLAFSYVVYKSKKDRNKTMDKLYKDKEFMACWDEMPFDGMRMIFGGFEQILNKKK